MRLQVEVPTFVHCDTPVNHCAIPWVVQLSTLIFAIVVLLVSVCCLCRIEPSVVTLANNNNGDFGWLRESFFTVELFTHRLDRFQLEI